MTGSPLLERNLSDTFAIDEGHRIDVAAFTANTRRVADALPDAQYAVNLCRNRVQFITAFAAVITAGQCNLLPPNRQRASLASIAGRYPGCYVIHDGEDVLPGVDNININDLIASATPATPLSDIPDIDDEQLCAVSFTSGSTGESQPNLKYWSTLRISSQINRRYMLRDFTQTQSMLATVPPQHMWGLETSVLLPMFANVCIHSGQPLYPMDISNALARLESPRVLVSTPAHLRVLFQSEIDYPSLQTVLSATAPLEPALAAQTESLLDAHLVEIYGCSEGGSLAYRRTATESLWQPFDGMQFDNHERGCTLRASHLPAAVELQDTIEFTSEGRFKLQGRHGDLVNVAGKRGSLSELNRHLLNIDGVVDGVIFEPPAIEGSTRQQRLAALVVAPDVSAKTIQAELIAHVDPVFVPRPIVFVNALPRSESSKLPRDAVLALYQRSRVRDG